MELFIITGSHDTMPEALWTLQEAQAALEDRYKGRGGSSLQFKEDNGSWVAWGDVDKEGQFTTLPERIFKIQVPGIPPGSAHHLPEGVAVRMEMRVTTRTSVTSFQHAEAGHVWDMVNPGRAYIVELFAARAGRALADQLTKGEPR